MKSLENLKSVKFGGFDKKDVIDMYTEITTNYKTAEREYEQKISVLSSDKGRLNAQIHDLGKEIEQYKALASGEDKAEEISKLKSEIESLNLALSEERKKNASSQDTITKLNADYKALSDKHKHYELLSVQIADTMIDAKEVAFKITEDARIKSQSTLSDANLSADQIIDDANTKSANIICSAKNNVDNIRDSLTSLKNDIQSFKNYYSNLSADVNLKINSIENVIKTISSKEVFEDDSNSTENEPKEKDSKFLSNNTVNTAINEIF